MIFLMRFGINKHLLIFQRPQIFVSLWKNLLVLIYSKLHPNHVISHTKQSLPRISLCTLQIPLHKVHLLSFLSILTVTKEIHAVFPANPLNLIRPVK